MGLFPYFYTAIGLVIGSFLNVCIYRLPRQESIVFPGSHCPRCGKAIPPYDNIPVLSYLLLRGKCRFCRQPISLQYPLVELLAGLAFYACYSAWGTAHPTFVNSIFLCVVIVLVFTDYHHQILPNVLTLPGIAAGIVLSPFQEASFFKDMIASRLSFVISADNPDAWLPWTGSVVGAILGGGILWVVAMAYQALRKKQGLGMGDVKMMAMVGAFIGWRLALLTIFVGSLLGSIVGIFLVIFGGRTLQSKLAFGTFLGAAAAIALFYGVTFLHWYIPA